MNSSAVSPWRCVRWLNLAHSKIMFFQTLKNSSILPRTCAYLPLWASLMLVDVRTSSASLLRQYSKVLICHSLLSLAIPDTMWKCSKRLLHFSHSSGLLKLNFARGHSGTLVIRVAQIDPTTSDTMWCCHYRVWVGHLYSSHYSANNTQL